MSVIWSGVTEQGAVVPVQVTDEGKVVAVGDGPEGDYLPLTGGNLTGDLTLGTDKIELNADGSGIFQGVLQTKAPLFATSASGVHVFSRQGDISGTRDMIYYKAGADNETTVAITKTDGSFHLGGSLPGAPNIALEGADGSATFAGSILTLDGQVKSNRTTATASCWNGSLNNSLTSRIYASGAAEFVSLKIGGTLPSAPNITLSANGKATFADDVSTTNGVFYATRNSGSSKAFVGSMGADENAIIYADGSALFSGDVVIGSRGEKWLIRESNGVAMLVPQSREAAPMIPEPVRDIPSELDLIEAALNEVMEKLRMTPPAGWPVWDGSDNP